MMNHGDALFHLPSCPIHSSQLPIGSGISTASKGAVAGVEGVLVLLPEALVAKLGALQGHSFTPEEIGDSWAPVINRVIGHCNTPAT
jgi:hypothetical protein